MTDLRADVFRNFKGQSEDVHTYTPKGQKSHHTDEEDVVSVASCSSGDESAPLSPAGDTRFVQTHSSAGNADYAAKNAKKHQQHTSFSPATTNLTVEDKEGAPSTDQRLKDEVPSKSDAACDADSFPFVTTTCNVDSLTDTTVVEDGGVNDALSDAGIEIDNKGTEHKTITTVDRQACSVQQICETYVVDQSIFRSLNPHLPMKSFDALKPGTEFAIPRTNLLLVKDRKKKTKEKTKKSDADTASGTKLDALTIPRVKLCTIKAFCDAYEVDEPVFRECNPSIPEDYGPEMPLPRFCVIKVPVAAAAASSSAVGSTSSSASTRLVAVLTHPLTLQVISLALVAILSFIIATFNHLTVAEEAELAQFIGVFPVRLLSFFKYGV